jgi:hypothetical protein
MQVVSCKYLVNPEVDVEGYMTAQYISMLEDYIASLKLTGKKCAVLYAGGVLLAASEGRNTRKSGVKLRRKQLKSTLAIKEVSAYSMHKYIGMIEGNENVCYANINGNTCASSMYSLYEAEQLLKADFDEVVIIAEEKTSYNTLRVFSESRIDLQVGEGVAIIHLAKNGTDITDCKWSYEYNRNPFLVTEEGYSTVATEAEYINPHGTGTTTNESAEASLREGKEELRYKEDIGHTQGLSGLIEVCMVLDENIKGDVLCVSSGLGGFYGSCVVHK